MSDSFERHATPKPEVSLIEDCVDIWSSPSKVFARRREGPYWGPYFVVAVLMLVLYYAAIGSMQGFLDAEVARAVTKMTTDNPQMTAEQVAGMQGMMEGSIKYGGLVMVPVLVLILGLVVFLMSKIFGGELAFGGGVMIASFAYMPRLLDSLLVILQSAVLDTSTWTSRYQWSLGVGRFMDPNGSQGLLNLVGRIDLFTIWVTVLIALGLQSAAKLPKEKAMLAAGIIWVLGALPALMQFLAGQ